MQHASSGDPDEALAALTCLQSLCRELPEQLLGHLGALTVMLDYIRTYPDK